MEDLIQETLAALLKNLQVTFRKFKLHEEPGHEHGKMYRIDVDTDEASTLIGYHGENIHALQHILKSLIWKKTNESVFVVIDVDGYRKRQEQSVVNMALRKVEQARKTMMAQSLPPMSPYFRRVVHLSLAKPEFEDIMTESIGEGDHRAVSIRVKES